MNRKTRLSLHLPTADEFRSLQSGGGFGCPPSVLAKQMAEANARAQKLRQKQEADKSEAAPANAAAAKQ